MAMDTEVVTQEIINLAREEAYDRHFIMNEACTRAGFKFPQKAVSLITALITAGALEIGDDDIVRPGKFATKGGGNTDVGQYETYKRRIISLEQDLERAKTKTIEAIAAAEAGIKAANEKAAAAQAQTRIVEVQVKNGTKTVKKMTGLFHAQFEAITTLFKFRKNVFIYGPTGSGKSFVCKQAADANDLPFYFVSCTSGMPESALTGRLLPVGKNGEFKYVLSEFVRAYETGGVFLLDEIDAADPNVMLVINSALANDRLALTNRPEKPYAVRHENFVCVGAANTLGTGADRLYAGRNKLDASTLDRFAIGKVFMDYDTRLEKELCPDEELLNMLWKYRTKIRQHRLERAMSTRFIRDAYLMKTEAGWTHDNINATFFQGWREDEKNKATMY